MTTNVIASCISKVESVSPDIREKNSGKLFSMLNSYPLVTTKALDAISVQLKHMAIGSARKAALRGQLKAKFP